MTDELTLLKEQAEKLGITHSGNIGVDTLRKKIDEHLNGPTKDKSEEDEGKDGKAPAAETVQERTMRIRAELVESQTALIRVRIANLNPAKADLQGEIITVGNKYIGTIRKMVPFGEGSENGYHLPKILVDDLRAREFNQIRTRKDPNKPGATIIEQKLVKEYAIEVLEPLTEKELEALARTQAAAAGQ